MKIKAINLAFITLFSSLFAENIQGSATLEQKPCTLIEAAQETVLPSFNPAVSIARMAADNMVHGKNLPNSIQREAATIATDYAKQWITPETNTNAWYKPLYDSAIDALPVACYSGIKKTCNAVYDLFHSSEKKKKITKAEEEKIKKVQSCEKTLSRLLLGGSFVGATIWNAVTNKNWHDYSGTWNLLRTPIVQAMVKKSFGAKEKTIALDFAGNVAVSLGREILKGYQPESETAQKIFSFMGQDPIVQKLITGLPRALFKTAYNKIATWWTGPTKTKNENYNFNKNYNDNSQKVENQTGAQAGAVLNIVLSPANNGANSQRRFNLTNRRGDYDYPMITMGNDSNDEESDNE